MTRDDVLRISRTTNNGSVSSIDASNMIVQYCIDNGKKESDAIKMIQVIMNTPFMGHFLFKALEYYEKKFNICKLHSNKQELLLIF